MHISVQLLRYIFALIQDTAMAQQTKKGGGIQTTRTVTIDAVHLRDLPVHHVVQHEGAGFSDELFLNFFGKILNFTLLI